MNDSNLLTIAAVIIITGMLSMISCQRNENDNNTKYKIECLKAGGKIYYTYGNLACDASQASKKEDTL